MASTKITEITDESFQSEVLGSPTTVLVDLWGIGCAPCKTVVPLLESLSADLGDRLKIVKLDIYEHPKVPATYRVTSIPTLLLFKGGELAGKMVGNPGRKSKIADFVAPHL